MQENKVNVELHIGHDQEGVALKLLSVDPVYNGAMYDGGPEKAFQEAKDKILHVIDLCMIDAIDHYIQQHFTEENNDE